VSAHLRAIVTSTDKDKRKKLYNHPYNVRKKKTSSCTLRYKIGKLYVISKNDIKLVENIHKKAVY